MKTTKKMLSIVFTFIFTMVTLLSSMPVQAAVKKVVVPEVQYASAPVTEYTAGDRIQFNINSPNFGGKVEYRVVLWDDSQKSYSDLWNDKNGYPSRYYTKWQPTGNTIFTLGWPIFEPGNYRITVYAKRVGVASNKAALAGMNCDSYKQSVAFTVKPKVTLLDKEGQTYGSSDADKLEIYNGDTKITANNIALSNVNVEGDLYIFGDNAVIKNVSTTGKIVVDPGKGGSTTLENVIAKNIEVLSGGQNSIHIKNVQADTMNVNSSTPVRIEADGDTEIVSTSATGYVIFDRKSGTYGTITITTGSNGIPVIEFRGDIQDKVLVETTATIKTGEDSKIANLVIATENVTDTVTLEGQYGTVEINSKVKVEVAANTNVENIVANTNTEINLDKTAVVDKVDKGTNTVVVGGEGTVGTGTTTPPPSTGGSDGWDPPVDTTIRVSAITVTGAGDVATITAKGGTLQMSAAVGPVDATNKAVTWSVEAGTGTATISSTGLLQALTNGTVTVKATSVSTPAVSGTKVITISGQTLNQSTITFIIRDNAVEAIPGATIIIDGKTLITDNEGMVTITLANGSYTIKISKDGYVTREETQSVSGSGSHEYRLSLPPTVINTAAIAGVTAPVKGATPVDAITATGQYTGEVTWTPAVVGGKFAADTAYTATITLTAKAGYTLTGVAANFFTVSEATATNAADSGVVTAVFPKTAAADIGKEITGYTALTAVTLDNNDHLVDLAALKASNKLPTTVMVTDGTTPAAATITEWTGAFDGTIAVTYNLTATWTMPEGYVDDVAPITVEITVNVSTVQTADTTVQDNLDIAAAKSAIEGATYTATQAEIGENSANAMAKAQALVDALELSETLATIKTTGVTFVAAIAGTSGNPAGTNGSLTFTVNISKGLGTLVTSTQQTMTITATAYVAPVTLESIAVKTPATKLVYTVGDELDITGLVIEGTYSDASKKDETITAANVTGFDSTSAVAEQTLTVTVDGKTATYTISIAKADGPALTGVTSDDAANTLSGMTAAMEFSTDGTAWTVYNAETPNLPDLTSTVALQVRFAATATHEAGAATTFNFTATPVVATPVITVSKTSAANREVGVTFSVGTVAGVTFYYTLDETAPTASSTAYSSAVTLTAPDNDAEATITIKVIGIKAGETDSEVATATVTYAKKLIATSITVSNASGSNYDIPATGNTSQIGNPFVATVKDQDGKVMAAEGVTWSVVDISDSSIIIGTDGKATIYSNAGAGTYKVTATSVSNSTVSGYMEITLSVKFRVAINNETANDEATLGLVGTTVTSSASEVATAEIAEGKIKITSVGAGSATITVKDNASNGSTIAVTVAANGDITIGMITKYVAPKNADATLSDLKVNGVTVTGFASATETYSVEVPFGTNVGDAAVTVTAAKNDTKAADPVITAATALPGATTVVVTAEDGTTKTYTINFTVAPSATVSDVTVSGTVGAYTSNNLLTITLINDSFKNQINDTVDVKDWFTNLPSVAQTEHYSIRTKGDTLANAITITIDVALTPSEVSDAVMQITIPASYLNSGKDLTVTTNSEAKFAIAEAPKSDVKAITAFSFAELDPVVTGVINEEAKTIALTVPYETEVTALVSTFTNSAKSAVKVGEAAQESGTTANDFTSPVSYVVTAEDGTTATYTVTVTVAANPAKAITAFSFAGLNPAVTGTVDESAKTVALTVPYGTAVSALVPTITHTGASLSPNTGVSQDFTNQVTYTVTAANATTQKYVVTVTVAGPEVTGFTFTATAGLQEGNANAATGQVAGTLSAPVGGTAEFTYSLVAGDGDTDNGKFEIDGANLKIKGNPLTEGTLKVYIQITDSKGKTFAKAVEITVAAAPLPAQSGAPAFTAGTPATYDTQLTVGAGNLGTTTNLTYTWYRSDNNTFESGSDTSLETGITYTPVAADIGKYLIVVASSTDATGTGFVATEAVVVDPVVAVAAGITSIAIPVKDQTQLVFPSVPEGYTITITDSSIWDVVALDGTINPKSWHVQLVFTVKNEDTGNTADTKKFEFDMPKSSAEENADLITVDSIGAVKVGDDVLAKAQALVSTGYTVTVKSAEGTCINSNGQAIATGTGTITFTVTKDGTAITADTVSLSIAVQLVDPVEDQAVAATAVNIGQTLANSTLSGTFKVSTDDNTVVAGTLAWDNDSAVVSATENFAWRFTPEDTATYNVVIGGAEVIAYPAPEIDYAAEKISGVDSSMEYTVDNWNTPDDVKSVTDAEIDISGIIPQAGNDPINLKIRVKGNSDSEKTLTINARPGTPAVYTINYITEKTVEAVPDTQEYDTEPGFAAATQGENSVITLTPNEDVWFRVKATETNFASNSIRLTVAVRPDLGNISASDQTATAKILLEEAAITTGDGYEYSLNEGAWADIETDATFDLSESDTTFVVRKKATSGAFASEQSGDLVI